MTRQDWLDYADHDAVRAEYRAGPQDLTELAPGVWGIPDIAVVCLGDRNHMRKVQAKRFHDRFIARPAEDGYYGPDYGGDPLPPVAERLGLAAPHSPPAVWSIDTAADLPCPPHPKGPPR